MAFSAYEFWNLVDDRRGDMALSVLAEKSGIKHQQIRHLRSEMRFPKAEEVIAIARVLGVSGDYLMGETNLMPACGYLDIVDRLGTASDIELAMVRKILGLPSGE